MTSPGFITTRQGTVCLAVKVQPRASKDQIGDALGNELKIKIRAAPVDSAANDALIRFLAERLNCPRGAVQIVRGHTSRHKILSIERLSTDDVLAKLVST